MLSFNVRKTLVCGIILLFIGASFTSSMGRTNWESSDLKDAGDDKNIQETEAESTSDIRNDIDTAENEEVVRITHANSIDENDASESDYNIEKGPDYFITVYDHPDILDDPSIDTSKLNLQIFSTGKGVWKSSGKEFFLVYTDGIDGWPNDGIIFITSEVDTSGFIEIPGVNYYRSFTVTANTITTIDDIPDSAEVYGSDIIDNKGIHVVTNDNINLYFLHQEKGIYSNDAYLCLPVNTLGTEHLVLSYNATSTNSQFTIVAPYNNTKVTITPSISTGIRPADVPYSIILDKFQTYTLKSDDANEDLTGTIVESNCSIAVFAGGKCLNIPVNWLHCDHIVEQMPPTTIWGTTFETFPFMPRQNGRGDILRILACMDNTLVTINGNYAGTIDRGENLELMVTNPLEINTSNKPVLVAQYLTGGKYEGRTGDPSMCLILPTDQFITKSTFISPLEYDENYVNIIAPTSSLNYLFLDGSPVNTNAFVAFGSRGLSAGRINLSSNPGTHTITGSKPFALYAYGYHFDGSYAYPCGSVAPDLKWAWPDSDPYVWNPSYNKVCMTPLVCNFPWLEEVPPPDIPNIVFITYKGILPYWTDGILRSIDGHTGQRWFDVQPVKYRVSPISTPAIGDIDKRYRGPEIVALADRNVSSGYCDQLFAFTNVGAHIWTSFPPANMNAGAAPSIADLDGDNVPEIIVEDKVFNNMGKLLAEDPLHQGTGKGISCVADVDLDGKPEIIAGNFVYEYVAPNQPLAVDYKNTTLSDGCTAIGNFDESDDEAEIVLVIREYPGDGYVYLLDPIKGTTELGVIWGPKALGGSGGGPPTIEDFNGDGFPDIGVTTMENYTVYDRFGNLIWNKSISDSSSGVTGSTVFDLKKDGVKDVICRDEEYLYILNGVTGIEQWRIACPSITSREMPVIADVDRDCHAEIIVGCNPGYISGDTGIQVYENDANWINARSIWNQYSYHITNIWCNGKIPFNEVNNWIYPWFNLPPLNNYRIQWNPPGYNPDNLDINGQTFGTEGREYEYAFVATDPDGHDIKYYIDWGDGNIEETAFYPSGVEAKASHTWNEEGTYTIGAKAIDIYELQSGWATLEVTMPVNIPTSQPSSQPFQRVLQQLPNAFPILRHMLGL